MNSPNTTKSMSGAATPILNVLGKRPERFVDMYTADGKYINGDCAKYGLSFDIADLLLLIAILLLVMAIFTKKGRFM